MIYLTVICGLLVLLNAGLVIALLLERKAMAELLAHFELMHQGERARIMSAPSRVVQPPSQPTKRLSPEEYDRMRQQARNNQLVGTVQHARPE